MNTAKCLLSTGLKRRNLILAAVLGCLCVLVAGCSKPSSSQDISGTWIEPVDLNNNSFTTWNFKSDGTLLAALTILGHAQDPESGTYKVRPAHGKIPGDIIEVAFPKAKTPTLFRIPPNASTIIVRVDADDDPFSGDRPERRVAKLQAGQSGPSDAQGSGASALSESVYKGKVVSVKATKEGGYTLRLDTTVYGKKLECAVMNLDVRKFGDLPSLQGKQVQVKGQPEEIQRTIILFLEDADQLQVVD